MLLLLRLAPRPDPPPVDTAPNGFTLLPDRTASPTSARRAAPRARAAPKAREEAKPPSPDTPRPPPPPAVDLNDPMMRLWGRRDLFEKGDVAKLRGAPGEAVAAADGEGDSDAVGTGPNGQRLYAAEWQREPTGSQLSPYVRPNAPRPGWGIVACRTIDDYRVDDCRQLGESPLGSGYASAVRQAAWQFRVRPPRIGGRPQVGTWVRIRIDYTVAAE